MTDAELAAEAKWMLEHIAREWFGCKPHSRFARSLPEAMKRCVGILREGKTEAGREEGKDDA